MKIIFLFCCKINEAMIVLPNFMVNFVLDIFVQIVCYKHYTIHGSISFLLDTDVDNYKEKR